MGREEEISRHAVGVGLKVRDEAIMNDFNRYSAEIISALVQRSVIQGAEWADQHPRKGLVDIEKIVEWIENNVEKYLYFHKEFNKPAINEFQLTEDLKKAVGKCVLGEVV